jgi:hypothetical protein
MFERLKRTLLESFIGAIALGYLLAQVIITFVNIFTAPVEAWVVRSEFREITPRTANWAGFPLQAALPQAISFFLLLLVWYALLRWLYIMPLKKQLPDAAPNPEQVS